MNSVFSKNIWLNINKPEGYSSARVVAIVKKITKAKKVGHGGTLDPFASGVLPIALNQATRTSEYVMNDRKKYFFTICWGEFRDTDDVEGKIIETSAKKPKTSEIINALPAFIGKVKQVPSKFSAIKIDGKRAYELARKNVEFQITEREIEIFSLKLIVNNENYAEFEVECSKGTYVRSLARDICKKIGVCGYVAKLIRLKVGKFDYKKTISLDLLKFATNYNPDFFDGSLLFLQDVLDMIAIQIDDLDSSRFKNGQMIKNNHGCLKPSFTGIFKVVNRNEVIGLAKLQDNMIKPINVFK